MAPAGATKLTPPLIGAVVVAVFLVFVMIGTSQIEPEAGDRAVDSLAFACGAIGAASLMLWRRMPVLVAAVVSVAIGVYLARGYPAGPAFLPGPLAMLALGYAAPRKIAWLGVIGLLVATTIGWVIADELLPIHLLFFPGWGAAAVLAGQALAARGERAAAERERVAHAHEREIANERLRIAQDLHDSVAHAMATINVQSGVAAHLVDRKPEQAAVALEAIRTASSDVLDELAAIVGVLRESDADAPLAPLAHLTEIPDLVDRARSDGLTVALDQTGDTAAISSPVGGAAYRVVQEALTNARRHAGAEAETEVVVAIGGDGELSVTVTDDGGQQTQRPPAQTSGGFGLVGMRERVEATGGSLTVRPASPAGFLVEATWPRRADR